MKRDYTDKISIKGNIFKKFFVHSMNSKVKGQFYKVVDNPVKYMVKNLVMISFLRALLGTVKDNTIAKYQYNTVL